MGDSIGEDYMGLLSRKWARASCQDFLSQEAYFSSILRIVA